MNEKFCLKNGKCCFCVNTSGIFPVVDCMMFGINDVRKINYLEPCPFETVSKVERVDDDQLMLFGRSQDSD